MQLKDPIDCACEWCKLGLSQEVLDNRRMTFLTNTVRVVLLKYMCEYFFEDNVVDVIMSDNIGDVYEKVSKEIDQAFQCKPEQREEFDEYVSTAYDIIYRFIMDIGIEKTKKPFTVGHFAVRMDGAFELIRNMSSALVSDRGVVGAPLITGMMTPADLYEYFTEGKPLPAAVLECIRKTEERKQEEVKEQIKDLMGLPSDAVITDFGYGDLSDTPTTIH